MAGGATTTTVAGHKLSLGCTVCGSREIVAVCHHCGLPFCADHLSRVELPWYRIDPEFRGLGLEQTAMGSEAIHCPIHRHARFNWRPFYWSAALLVLALAIPAVYVFLNNGRPSPTLLVLFLGASAAFILGFLADLVEDLRSAPPLPVLGRDPAVQILEFLGGQIALRPDGAYQVNTTEAAGTVRFELAPTGAEPRRRDALRRRYSPLRLNRLQAMAGFLALRGKAHVEFQDGGGAALERRPHVLALSQTTQDHPFFPLDGSARPFQVNPRYKFTLDGPLPVQLIPTLVADQSGLGLELTVQLRTAQPGLLDHAEVVVKELLLCAPEALGAVRSRRPATVEAPEAVRCNEPDTPLAVYWQDISRQSDDDSSLVTALTPGFHRTFFVRFEHGERLPYTTLNGRLVLAVENRLLSGLQDALLFYPLGQRRELAATYHSEIHVQFRLSLSGLTITAPVERDVLRSYSGSLDYRQILSLVRTLSEQDFYVKSVVEHAAAVAGRNHGRYDHSWTLSGRRYEGFFPVSFEINVSCGEQARAAADEIAVQLHVSAQVGRGDTLAAFQATVAALQEVCDRLFGASQTVTPAPQIRLSPAPERHAPQTLADPAAALPPGYDRERLPVDEQETGI